MPNNSKRAGKTKRSSAILPKYCFVGNDQQQQYPEQSRSETRSDASATSAETEATSFQSLLLTEPMVKAHLQDYCDDLHANSNCKTREVWEALYEKYHAPHYHFLRPSGNPLTYQGCIDILCTDYTPHSCELVSVESVQLMAGGLAAVVTYTADETFSFKGTRGEDRLVTTMVLEVTNGEIKTVFSHRCTGQPIPKQTRWNAV